MSHDICSVSLVPSQDSGQVGSQKFEGRRKVLDENFFDLDG